MAYRPPCSLSEIPNKILDVYGLHVTVLQELDSYDDKNVLVEIDANSPLPANLNSLTFTKFKVNITNEHDSAFPERLAVKNEIILHLKKAGFPTPGVLPTLRGSYQELVSLGDSQEAKYVLRLFEYFPGVPMERVCLTKSICRDVGKTGGWMDVILKDFNVEDNRETMENLHNHWNMSEIAVLKSKLHFVDDIDTLHVVQNVIADFESRVLQCQNMFSKGVIHGDLNDCNILVVKTLPSNVDSTDTDINKGEDGVYTVSSVIDFGDCTFSLHVFEVAVAMCYVMIKEDVWDVMESAASVLSGYLENVTLSKHDLLHLRITLCARLAQSYVFGKEKKAEDSGNDYSQRHCNRTWPLLERLWKMSDEEFLLGIMGHYKSG